MFYRILAVLAILSYGSKVLSNDLMQKEIKHVVVLMLENRSFDNVLGWLYSKDTPSHIIPARSKLPFQGLSSSISTQFTNALVDSSGNIVFTCSPIEGIPSTEGTKMLNSPGFDPNEPFDNVTKQIYNGGAKASMLGFLQDYASLWDESEWKSSKKDICAVMESYTSDVLPVLYGLASHYAVSDLWFSSVPTQTNPNRAFSVCGTSEGQIVNGPLGKSTFQSDTLWNRLSELTPDSTWTIFWQTDMLPGIFPGPYYSKDMFVALGKISNLESHYQKLDLFHELARKGELPDFSIIEPEWTFAEGVELAELQACYPDSQYLAGLQGNDLHPPGDVRTGENLVANIYTSLIANPESWNDTLFIILFDEHGGIFDHISPPIATPPDNHFEKGFKFDRYGVRTPAIFISPRIKKGTVIRSTTDIPFDHTSLISTVLKWKNIDPGQWNMGNRTAVAPTFERVITERIPRNDPIPMLPIDNAQNIDALDMGDKITLKSPDGSYFSLSRCECYATVDTLDKSASIQFTPIGGKITHGSFVLIQLNNPSECDQYVLDTASAIGDTYFNINTHLPSQWWTVKSVDNPYLGYEIKNGDRIYLEAHIYLDPLNYVPCRLTTAYSLLLGKSVTTKPITDQDADSYYWIIEKE